jgi:hypothetical protein
MSGGVLGPLVFGLLSLCFSFVVSSAFDSLAPSKTKGQRPKTKTTMSNENLA